MNTKETPTKKDTTHDNRDTVPTTHETDVSNRTPVHARSPFGRPRTKKRETDVTNPPGKTIVTKQNKNQAMTSSRRIRPKRDNPHSSHKRLRSRNQGKGSTQRSSPDKHYQGRPRHLDHSTFMTSPTTNGQRTRNHRRWPEHKQDHRHKSKRNSERTHTSFTTPSGTSREEYGTSQ